MPAMPPPGRRPDPHQSRGTERTRRGRGRRPASRHRGPWRREPISPRGMPPPPSAMNRSRQAASRRHRHLLGLAGGVSGSTEEPYRREAVRGDALTAAQMGARRLSGRRGPGRTHDPRDPTDSGSGPRPARARSNHRSGPVGRRPGSPRRHVVARSTCARHRDPARRPCAGRAGGGLWCPESRPSGASRDHLDRHPQGRRRRRRQRAPTRPSPWSTRRSGNAAWRVPELACPSARGQPDAPALGAEPLIEDLAVGFGRQPHLRRSRALPSVASPTT